jgi:hypothetical protein
MTPSQKLVKTRKKPSKALKNTKKIERNLKIRKNTMGAARFC